MVSGVLSRLRQAIDFKKMYLKFLIFFYLHGVYLIDAHSDMTWVDKMFHFLDGTIESYLLLLLHF